MSGTSLDGLDIALCRFSTDDKKTVILKAETVAYSGEWKQKLGNAQRLDAMNFWKLHVEYGHFLGKEVKRFLQEVKEPVDAVASHGHTVFHQPQHGFTCQLGDGAALAAESGITAVCDFRSTDVALGGQGAPLVPVGDQLLFAEHSACLNIGGIANISFDKNGERKAFDICPANLVFNTLAQRSGKPYDEEGKIALQGKVNEELLEKLNKLEYYRIPEKKSIGREWIEEEVLIRIDDSGLDNEDKMATAAEHAAMQIAHTLNNEKISDVLITGGGAYNRHLLSRIANYSSAVLTVPDRHIVEFKEALIFAFLGMLRLQEKHNTLKSVTGAAMDSVGGAVYFMQSKKA